MVDHAGLAGVGDLNAPVIGAKQAVLIGLKVGVQRSIVFPLLRVVCRVLHCLDTRQEHGNVGLIKLLYQQFAVALRPDVREDTLIGNRMKGRRCNWSIRGANNLANLL